MLCFVGGSGSLAGGGRKKRRNNPLHLAFITSLLSVHHDRSRDREFGVFLHIGAWGALLCGW